MQFPDRWVIKNPNNVDSTLIYKLFKKLTGTTHTTGTYFHFPEYAKYCYTSPEHKPGYTLITIEDLKEHFYTEYNKNSKYKRNSLPLIKLKQHGNS